VKADCIFVFAGRQNRKEFGLRLYGSGYADQIVLSVGRFEWRRFSEMGLAHDGGLLELVNRTPPVRRHFFVHLGPHGATCLLVPKGRFGTWTEASSITSWARKRHIRSLLVVSTGFHLRRVIATLRAQEGSEALSFHPVAAAGHARDPDDRLGILVWELGKFFLYRMAAWATSRRSKARMGNT
jgi:uncharacterized SAM-binding protein YcdF (DUF218 family)